MIQMMPPWRTPTVQEVALSISKSRFLFSVFEKELGFETRRGGTGPNLLSRRQTAKSLAEAKLQYLAEE